MNASVLLELAREWHNLAMMASASSLALGSANVPIEVARQALDVAKRALAIAGELEQLAARWAEDSRRD